MKIRICFLVLLLQTAYTLGCLCPSPHPVSTDLKYYLYEYNCTSKRVVQIHPDNLSNVKLQHNVPTILLTHGLLQNSSDPPIKSFVSAVVKETHKVNIISVDWSSTTGLTDCTNFMTVANEIWPQVALRTCCLGDVLGEAIIKLIAATNSSPKHFHLIGFSGGAHLMGCAGQYVYENAGEKIGRITGLDTAGPVFQYMSADCRLSSDDATFVDCYHTNDDFTGSSLSWGHVDIYVNGGKKQPPCPCDPDSYLFSFSHSYSWILFTQSVNHHLTAYIDATCPRCVEPDPCECHTTQKMSVGYHINKSIRGIIYIETNTCSPHAKHRDNTCPESSESSESFEHEHWHWH